MINIEFKENLDDEICELIDVEFNKFAEKNGVICDYTPFGFAAKDGDKIVGMIKGHSLYKEVCIGELIVIEEYRRKNIGTELIGAVEKYCKENGFENISLSTYGFQAPEFYKKCGFTLEFIREDKKDPKLTKYFFVKFFNRSEEK